MIERVFTYEPTNTKHGIMWNFRDARTGRFIARAKLEAMGFLILSSEPWREGYILEVSDTMMRQLDSKQQK